MFLDLIIVVCVALAAVGVVLLGCRLLRVRPSKAVAPAVAGLAIIAFTAWYRYDWAERTVAALPDGAVVLAEYPYEGWLEPWTRLWPRADRLLVLDGAATLRHPDHPGLALVKLDLLDQNEEALQMHLFVDCAARRRAPVTPAGFAAGRPAEGDWQPADDPPGLIAAVCR